MDSLAFIMTTDEVEWSDLKAALAEDKFDNGRTPEEYQLSHENSYATVVVRQADRIVGNGRLLSDGVCNAYLVDIWTAPSLRRQGIGREIVTRLLATVPGQHVGLFTDDASGFYGGLGFAPEVVAMSLVLEPWLGRSQT